MLQFGRWLGVVSVLVLSACQFTIDPKVTVNPGGGWTVDTDLGDKLVTCSATLVSGTTAASGQATPIKVVAQGGAAPYQLVDSAVAFQTETVISRTYENNTSANVTQVDTVVIKDAVGFVSQCNFLVTVTPASTPPSTLACTLTAAPVSPAVGANVLFTGAATGGTAPYTFSALAMGSDSTVVTALAPASSTSATAVGKYNSAGLRTASIKLTDSTATEVVCQATVSVIAAASVNLTPSPSSSVVVGNAITVTAAPSGFSTTPTYTFTATRNGQPVSGVSIAQNGAVATVTSSSIQSQFDFTVVATAGAQSATKTITLGFSAATSLACSISHTSGTLYTGDNVTFTASATNGEPLEITYFATHSDGVVQSQTSNTRVVKYSVAGVKVAYVQAKSTSTGALCQSGGVMTDVVQISPPVVPALTCTAFTSPNPSYTYQALTAWASISGGSGSQKWVESIDVTLNGASTSLYSGYWTGATSASLTFYYQGSYGVKMNIRDSAGNTGSCSTTQSVWY